MHELTTNQKGLIAETALIHEAVKLGVSVERPLDDERYDLIFDFDGTLVRVQCKWARRCGDVVVVRCNSCRRTAGGQRRRPYTSTETDAIAAYCPEVGRCYLIPGALFSGRTQLHLRLERSKNNQTLGINWARNYEFGARLPRLGPIAQLGERRHGMPKAVGSSPTGSIR